MLSMSQPLRRRWAPRTKFIFPNFMVHHIPLVLFWLFAGWLDGWMDGVYRTHRRCPGEASPRLTIHHARLCGSISHHAWTTEQHDGCIYSTLPHNTQRKYMQNPFGFTPRLIDCDLKIKKSRPPLVLHMRHTLVFFLIPPRLIYSRRVKIQVRLSATLLPLNLCRCETTFSLSPLEATTWPLTSQPVAAPVPSLYP